MGMSTRGIIGMLVIAGSAISVAPASAISMLDVGQTIVIGADDMLGPQVTIDEARVDRDTIQVRHSLPRDGQRQRRAKGPQAKPRARSNRLHVSKRTRRKHRRAA